MWNKRDEELGRPMPPQQPGVAPPAPVQPQQPAPSERYDTASAAIGSSIKIVGDVSGDEDLTILGKIEGKILLPKHSVTIGQSGRVKADIQAKFVSVAGEVHGNLVAAEQIVIRKTATMLGNLTAPRVGLEDGCRFRGSVEMEAPPEKPRPAGATVDRSSGTSSGSSAGTSVASSSPSTVSAPKHEPLARP
jgi:cytoskeletal protein CcmA (bactofilin family)